MHDRFDEDDLFQENRFEDDRRLEQVDEFIIDNYLDDPGIPESGGHEHVDEFFSDAPVESTDDLVNDSLVDSVAESSVATDSGIPAETSIDSAVPDVEPDLVIDNGLLEDQSIDDEVLGEPSFEDKKDSFRDGLALDSLVEAQMEDQKFKSSEDKDYLEDWGNYYEEKKPQLNARYPSYKDNDKGLGGGYSKIHADPSPHYKTKVRRGPKKYGPISPDQSSVMRKGYIRGGKKNYW